jgi:hypothetical protein
MAEGLLSPLVPMELRRLASTEASALAERLVAAMEGEIEATTKRIQASADSALAEGAQKIKELTAALTDARTNEQTLREALEKASAGEKALRATIGKIEADHEKRRETLERAVQKIREGSAATQVALDKMAAAKATADARYLDAQRVWSADIRAVREAAAAAVSADLEYFRRTFKRLEEAPTLKDAITEFANSLAAVFPRVALFNVNGQRLEGRWQTGFNFTQDVSSVFVPLTKGTAFGEAVQSDGPRQLGSNDLAHDTHKTLFGGTPSFGLIVPLVIDGTPAAVVYADDSGRTGEPVDPQRAAGSAAVLLLHALPFLAGLSRQEKVASYESHLLSQLQIV